MGKGPRAHYAVITFDRCTELPDEDSLMTSINEQMILEGLPTVRKVTYITDQAITLNVDLTDVCKAMEESDNNL